MNINLSYRALLPAVSLFVLFGGIIWVFNVLVQSSFPGNHLFPVVVRVALLVGVLTLTYYVNIKFIRKNGLNAGILNFRRGSIQQYLLGSLIAILVIVAIWAIIYLVYPFDIINNANSKTNLVTDLITYSLGNTLEELLFRGFLLLAAVRLLGKINGVLFISLLFGLFHLQGTGMTMEGISMFITTFTMSLLFISVIYYSKSIWTAVTLHITGNLLLHTIGFDGANNGMVHIRFATSNTNGLLITLIYEMVVLTFALFLFSRAEKQI